jgi:hypothetical protein
LQHAGVDSFVNLFRAVFVQVAATTPHVTGGLIAVSPYMTELLRVIALRQAIFVSVSLYLDGYMAEACQFKDTLRLLSPRKGDEEKWEIGLSRIFGGRPAGGGHLPDAGYIKARSTSAS